MSEEEGNRPTRTAGPTREGDSLADVVEMLLDKGIVLNADIAVTVGETELLGIHIRAALASFETAAEYGLQFPDGTDMRRVEEASGRSQMHSEGGAPISVRGVGTPGVSPAPGTGQAGDDEADGSGSDDEEQDGEEDDSEASTEAAADTEEEDQEAESEAPDDGGSPDDGEGGA